MEMLANLHRQKTAIHVFGACLKFNTNTMCLCVCDLYGPSILS